MWVVGAVDVGRFGCVKASVLSIVGSKEGAHQFKYARNTKPMLPTTRPDRAKAHGRPSNPMPIMLLT